MPTAGRESRGLSLLSCSAGPRCGRCLPTPPGLPNKCHSAESPGGGRDEHVTQQRAFPGLIQICRRGNGLDGFGRAPAAFPQDRLQVMQRTLRPAPSRLFPARFGEESLQLWVRFHLGGSKAASRPCTFPWSTSCARLHRRGHTHTHEHTALRPSTCA